MSGITKTTTETTEVQALAAEVRRLAGLAGEAMHKTLEAHRDTGAALIKLQAAARNELADWDRWCPVHCGMTARHARRLSNIASGWKRVESRAKKLAKAKDGPMTLVEAERVARGLPIREAQERAKAAKKDATTKANEVGLAQLEADKEARAKAATSPDTVPTIQPTPTQADPPTVPPIQPTTALDPVPVPMIPQAQAQDDQAKAKAQDDPSTASYWAAKEAQAKPRFARADVEEAIAQAHAQVSVDVVAAILRELGLEVV